MSIGGLELRTLQGERLVVTGGSRGLGLGIVAALLARGAQVPWSPAIRGRLADVERLGAAARPGDVTDPALMSAVVADVKPAVLILNAGAAPLMAPLDEAILGRVHCRVEHGREGRSLRHPGGTEGTAGVRRARADRVERHRWKPAVGRVCRHQADALGSWPITRTA
jgi:NAD(P)-dependent dehydrogenase (short-subunit alcohol dehydrogenase family)